MGKLYDIVNGRRELERRCNNELMELFHNELRDDLERLGVEIKLHDNFVKLINNNKTAGVIFTKFIVNVNLKGKYTIKREHCGSVELCSGGRDITKDKLITWLCENL